MIRRPPRSTLDRSSAASDVYKRQFLYRGPARTGGYPGFESGRAEYAGAPGGLRDQPHRHDHPVSYTHLRAHETVLDLVCRLLLEKKK